MAKKLYLVIMLISFNLQAAPIKGSLGGEIDIAHAMEQFNPATILKDFSTNPPESKLPVEEGDSVLRELGKLRVAQDATASMVLEQEQSRSKIKLNPNASEIEYAERLIDNAEGVVHPACFKEPVPCIDHAETKTCEETSNYITKSCESSSLNVHLNKINHHKILRKLYLDGVVREGQINLTACHPSESTGTYKCGPIALITLNPKCEHLEVKGVQITKGPVYVTQQPTCDSPIVTLNYGGAKGLAVELEVTEYWSDEDTITKNDCSKTALATEFEFCAYESTSSCKDPNATKIINGIPITRKCWGETVNYQCLSGKSSNCSPLIDLGCSQTGSQCLSKNDSFCNNELQTYQCITKECFPDREICPPSQIPCANGDCDNTKDEHSDDINEGLSKLGTLAGTADEVATNQVNLGQAAIFRGVVQKCEKYPLGIRDCCTDDGILDFIINCPKELKDLQQAKAEKRVVSLGRYTDSFFDTWHYVYCVFPSKLAGIIQLQGRGAQLHIPFGKAEAPDCRGITPEELEHINFSLLDISDLVAEFTGRKNFPASEGTSSSNTEHVSRLEEEGRPYD